MPPVTRLGDGCTGHGCFGGRPNAAGSGDVLVNSLPAHRQTDGWNTHCCVVCHGGSTSAGSGTVYANSLQLARIGDPVDCGSGIAAGSGDVLAGG